MSRARRDFLLSATFEKGPENCTRPLPSAPEAELLAVPCMLGGPQAQMVKSLSGAWRRERLLKANTVSEEEEEEEEGLCKTNTVGVLRYCFLRLDTSAHAPEPPAARFRVACSM